MNAPGEIVTAVAPVVTQFNVLFPPVLILAELEVKELTIGKAAPGITLTVAFAVPASPPASLVAVSL